MGLGYFPMTYLSNRPSKDIQFAVTEKQQIFTFDKLESEKNGWNEKADNRRIYLNVFHFVPLH